jgi:hypothetical protein
MRLIHCTKRLISYLHIYVQPKDESHINNGLGDWYANIFDFNRRYCLLFTNEKTLVTFFVPDLLKKDLTNFHDYFLGGIQNILNYSGLEKDLIDIIILDYLNLQIVTTESRSVLASMNDLIQVYKFVFGKEKHTFIKTIQHFNQNILDRPMGALNFATPMERLKVLISLEY